MVNYDFIIIGSGLGGLECATILSKEGYSVCVLEKNPIVGGCFQSFRRAGSVMDTGIHYIGSMDEGQILHQYFKYFGILDKIKLRRLDNDAFDIIQYKDKAYQFAMGFDNFSSNMAEYFPREQKGIELYTNQIKQIYDLISVENLKKGIISAGGIEYFSQSASHMIESAVSDPYLRNILSGNNTLYAGKYDDSTLYHHAMVSASNIAGAYRFVDGSQSVADAFVEVIRSNGGAVFTKQEVVRICIEDGKISGVEVKSGEVFRAKNVISNIHPVQTLTLLDKTHLIKKAYLTRMNSLPNTYGLFTVYLKMKRNSYPYINSNLYFHDQQDSWYANTNPDDKNIHFALLCNQANSLNEKFADVVTILSPMHYDEVAEWNDTTLGNRGDGYLDFKTRKAEEIIDFCAQFQPMLKSCIGSVYTSSPLTYRDYTGTPEGSAYGIMKSCKNPMITLIPTRTKIENLFLTGQNLNVHGALGVTLTATLTCSEFLGKEYLAKKIGNA